MHETALMENLIETIEKAVEDRNVVRITRVTIAVGKLSNVLIDALEFAFEALTQHGIMKGAKLEIEHLPATARCDDCGCEYQAGGFPIVCPACNSNGFTIISGDEVFVQSIECEENDMQ